MDELKRICIVVALVVLAGCAAPKYEASPIPSENFQDKAVVIINDEKTRKGFQTSMENWLRENNYTYSVSADGSMHDTDKLTLEYEGHWGWDIALYLNDAYIEAFRGGQRVGKVEFKAPNTLSSQKFGDGESRISNMMGVLFDELTVEEANELLKTN